MVGGPLHVQMCAARIIIEMHSLCSKLEASEESRGVISCLWTLLLI